MRVRLCSLRKRLRTNTEAGNLLGAGGGGRRGPIAVLVAAVLGLVMITTKIGQWRRTIMQAQYPEP